MTVKIWALGVHIVTCAVRRMNMRRGYHLCLWKAGLPEASMEQLLDTADSSATPGLYVLQALPSQLNAATLPVRRLICRPRPFC